MSNTVYNKVTIDGTTYMDLSQDTVASANHIRQGYVGHLNDGTSVTGTYSGTTPTLITKSITQNGTYSASSDSADGYSSVTVNVSGGGSSDWVTLVDTTVSISQGSPNSFSISPYTEPVGQGEMYRVTWGNASHVYVSLIDGVGISSDGYYFGNPAAYGGTDDGSGIYLLCYRNNTTLVGLTTDSGSKYLKIEKNTRTLNLEAKTNINPTTSSQLIKPTIGYDALASVQINAMPSGTAGTPTATKGTVSNHSVSVTPSVTNTTGYITGGTVTGTAVTVSASELVSGSETKTVNGTYDVTNLAQLIVNVTGGSGLVYETGTYSPASDTAEQTIYFTNAHTNRPFIVILSDATTSTANTNSNLCFTLANWYDAFGTPFYSASNTTQYARIQYAYKSSSGSSASGNNVLYLTGTANNTMEYWLTNTWFKAYTGSASRYWRSGRTYKWVAVWMPST